MLSQKTIFSQITDFLPADNFAACVTRYKGHYKVQHFSCWDQFLCLFFGQLTYRESLRDIETCLRARQCKLYHMGFRGHISRSTLADANQNRDWRIFADFTQLLIRDTSQLYADTSFDDLDITETIYAFDSTTIKLCLSLFPWAHFRKNQGKGAVKMHTLLNLRGNMPTFILITAGAVHDVNALDDLPIEPGAIYIFDRGYIDFGRLFRIETGMAVFIVRAKKISNSNGFIPTNVINQPASNRIKLVF